MGKKYKPGIKECVKYVANRVLEEDPVLACVLAHSDMEDYLLPVLIPALTWEMPEPDGDEYPDGSKTLEGYLGASFHGEHFWEGDGRDRNRSFVDYLAEHSETFPNEDLIYWCKRKSALVPEAECMLQNIEDIEYTGQDSYEDTVLSLNQVLYMRLAAGFISALKVPDKND